MNHRRLLTALSLPTLLSIALAQGCSSDSLDGCPVGQLDCLGVCVTPAFDPGNCGECGNACSADQVCSLGQCTGSCGTGTTDCSGACVNTDYDPSNCGECGTMCPEGQVCSQGACGTICGGGTTKCADKCVDTAVDEANCGDCGTTCSDGEICKMGVCEKVCDTDETLCGSDCVDTAVDENHCGSCDNQCMGNDVCVAGSCDKDEPIAAFLTHSGDVSAGQDLFTLAKHSLQTVKVNGKSFNSPTVIDYAVSSTGDLLFVAAQDTEGVFELYVRPAAGGAAVKLSGALVAGGNVLPGIWISKDGSKALYRADAGTDEVFELYLVDISQPGMATKLNAAMPTGGDVTSSFMLSGDGKQAVYVADGSNDGLPEAYTVTVASPGNATKVSANQNNFGVADAKISGDGATVVYRADEDKSGRLELYKVAVTSPGNSTKLNVTGDGGEGNVYGEVGNYLFSSDDKNVFYNVQKPNSFNGFELQTVDLATAKSTKLSSSDQGSVAGDFWVKSDDSVVLYRWADNSGVSLQSVAVATPGQTTRVSQPSDGGEGGSTISDFVVSGDEKFVACRLGGDGAEGMLPPGLDSSSNADIPGSALQVVDLAMPGKATTVIKASGAQGVYNGYAIGKDGSWVLYRADLAVDGRIDVHYAPLADLAETKNVSPKLATNLGNIDNGPRFDKSGDHLFWVADYDAPDRYELYRANAATPGTATRMNKPMPVGADVADFVIAADGKSVAYVADAETDGLYELFFVDTSKPEMAVKLNAQTGQNIGDYQISPDGKHVVYRYRLNAIDNYYGLYLVDTSKPGVATKLHGTLQQNGSVASDFVLSNSAVFYRADAEVDGRLDAYKVDFANPGNAVRMHAAGANSSVDVNSLALSNDLSTLVYTQYDGVPGYRTNLYRVPVASPGNETMVHAPLNPSATIQGDFKLTSDDKKVVVRGDLRQSYYEEIFVLDMTTPAAPVLVSGAMGSSTRDVSQFILAPDNNIVLFRADPEYSSRDELWLSRLDNPGVRTRVHQAMPSSASYDVYYNGFGISPDSSRIFYYGDLFSSSRERVYYTDVSNLGVSTQISVHPTTSSVYDVRSLTVGAKGLVVWEQQDRLLGVPSQSPAALVQVSKWVGATDVSSAKAY